MLGDSIKSLLEQNGYIESDNLLVSSLLIPQLQVIGFIPEQLDLTPFESFRYIPSDTSTREELNKMYNLNSDLIVNSYRLRAKDANRTLPIMTKVEELSSGEYVMDEESITVWSVADRIKTKGQRFTTCVIRAGLRAVKNNDTKITTYKAEKNLYKMTRSIGVYSVISASFLCLCRYVNAVTGNLNFILLSPNDIFVIDQSKRYD